MFYGHLVYFLVHFSRFGMLYQEKSGNPGRGPPLQLALRHNNQKHDLKKDLDAQNETLSLSLSLSLISSPNYG
jgi:hypothetical protein